MKHCGYCKQPTLPFQWDELMNCCTECASGLERPSFEWMRRDRHPPNLKLFAPLFVQLELERQERNRVSNADQ